MAVRLFSFWPALIKNCTYVLGVLVILPAAGCLFSFLCQRSLFLVSNIGRNVYPMVLFLKRLSLFAFPFYCKLAPFIFLGENPTSKRSLKVLAAIFLA